MVRWSSKQLQHGAVLTQRNKFGNKKTFYNGRTYHSKKEAEYAMQLDMLLNARVDAERVVSWVPQVTYHLVVNGVKIADYRLDFKVEYADGRIEYVDVKGYLTDEYKIKKKLMKALFNIDIIEV